MDEVLPRIVTRARGVRKRFVTPDTRSGYRNRRSSPERSHVASAESLSERIDALAAALHAAGVAPDRIASILGTAATATMHALVLEALVDEGARAPAEPGGEPRTTRGAQPLRIAA